MHPDAHRVRLPSGSDLYFTLPFYLDTRQPMPPQDLAALDAYLERTPPHPSEGPSGPTHQNNLEVRSIISDWLEGSQYLDDMEMYAWESGHGFPIFDEFGMPVDFQWVWDVIAFEGGEELISRYVEYINDSAELHAQGHAEDHHDSASIGRATRTSHTPPPGSPLEQPQHHRFGRFRVATQSDGPVSVGGADFANMDDCLAFLDTLTDIEAKLLSKNVIQLEGDSSTGMRMVPGPNAKVLPERASQAKKEAFQIHSSPADHQIRHVHVQQADLQPIHIHTITANPPSHSVNIRQEDQGPKPIVFLHESAVKLGKKPVHEQKLAFKRVASPPNQTAPAELDPFRFYGREPAHEARHEAVNEQRLFDERKSRIIEYQNLAHEHHQASRKISALQSREPLKKAHAKAIVASLRGGGRELERMLDRELQRDCECDKEKEKLPDIYVQHTKAAQQPSSSPTGPGYTSSKKSTRIPAPKTAVSEARPRTSGAEPSAHRSLSFEEPTRLPMRPKAAGGSSSYETGVDDSTYRVCGITPHQAHAEDSPDDSTESSPRPAPGSWMDALEELMS